MLAGIFFYNNSDYGLFILRNFVLQIGSFFASIVGVIKIDRASVCRPRYRFKPVFYIVINVFLLNRLAVLKTVKH